MSNEAPAAAPVQSPAESANSVEPVVEQQPVVAAPLTPKEIKKFKSLKLKVDGKEYDEALPFELDDNPEIRDYLTKKLQMANVAQKRMGEYSQLEGEVRGFIEQLRKDPKAALSNPNIGVDLKKLAAAVIEEEIANSQKSPEQLERERIEAELKSLKEERENEKKTWEAKEFERLQEQEMERYDVQISTALEGSDLPKSPYVVKKMADYLLMGLQAGIDVSPSDVLPLVRDEIMNDIKQMFGVMPEEVIEKMIGKDILGKMRKKKVANAKAAPPQPLKSSIKDVGVKGEKKAPEAKKNYKDFFGI